MTGALMISMSVFDQELTCLCSAFTGLKQALQDPKVYIMAVMTCAQLLGLSFVNFFPTYVVRIVTDSMLNNLILQTHRHVGLRHHRQLIARCVSSFEPFILVSGLNIAFQTPMDLRHNRVLRKCVACWYVFP